LDDLIVAARDARATTPWVRPAPLREALTALALATEAANPFRLATAEAAPRVALGAAAAAPVAPAPSPRRRPLGERFRPALRGFAVKAAGQLRQLPPQNPVHIAPATDYNGDLAGVLQRQYEAFRPRVPLQGKRVVLKPNLVEYHRDKVINTHPHVVAAVI